jgi:signal transduction histidine kinase
MRLPFSPRYFLASALLLAALTALFAILVALRTQRELSRELEEKGLSLADSIETASRAAILGNALMEEMIAQRLLDNARLVDQLVASRPPDPEWLREVSTMNRLRRVELLDAEGRPYTPIAPPPRMMPMPMRRMMQMPDEMPGRHEEAARDHRRAMMLYMWGRQWAPAPQVQEPPPPAIQDRRFWEGSVFGVAVGARSFPGIIAVHADADYVLNFKNEIGVQHQVEELGRQPGIEFVTLLDPSLTVVASSDRARLGARDSDAALRTTLESRGTLTRLVVTDGPTRVYEVARPLTLSGSQTGLLRIGLSTASLDRVWRRDRLNAVVLALGVLGLGVLGLAAIFYIQHRHLAEVKALETEMERNERLSTLGDMAAAVAHEIRNPLNSVSMGLQRLRVEFTPSDTEEYQRLLDLVQGEVRRLNTIVEEFLALARPLALKPESIRVPDLLDEVRLLVEPGARNAGVHVEQTSSADLPSLRADRDRLKQVLLNLALNALQAMPSGGRLVLSATATGGAFTLTVSDTGSGIAPELLPRIFDPYVTTKARGLGLGLAIARRIVEAHGGRIEAASQPGQGSTFRVIVPLGANGN